MNTQQRKISTRTNGCTAKLSPGSCLTDMAKKTWLVGPVIGAGSFGDVYLVSKNLDEPVSRRASHVAKVEPIASGPLFVEKNAYLRLGIKDKIEKWKKERGVMHLGVPHMVAFGNQSYGSDKLRFIVIPRYGEDLASVFNRYGRKFSLKTVINIGLQTIDILEYIHYNGYAHVDVKGQNLMLGMKKGDKNKVYLLDYGLAVTFVDKFGVHKTYGEDRRRAHDGTLEYTSRDAHIGAHSRRGDLETLGYNLVEWLAGVLPWAGALHDPDQVAATKNVCMANIPLFMKKCFPQSGAPDVLKNYLEYVSSLKFCTAPDYNHIRSIFTDGLTAAGLSDDGILEFGEVSSKKQSFRTLETDHEILLLMNNDKPSPKVLRSVQVLEKKSKRLGSSRKSPEDDLSNLVERNPQDVAKINETNETETTAADVSDLDPFLKQPKENVGFNPTPAMLNIMVKWQLNNLCKNGVDNKAKAQILQDWYTAMLLKFQASPPSPRVETWKNAIGKESCKKSSLIEQLIKYSGGSTLAMQGIMRTLIQCCKRHIEPSRVLLNNGLTTISSCQSCLNDQFSTEDDEPLRRRSPPIPNSPILGNRNNPRRYEKRRIEFASECYEERTKSRRHLRATPARRQRSTTPFDTFYTPYRGPSHRSRSPSPRKRGRPPKNFERRDRPRKRGRPRKLTTDHSRTRHSPSPRRKRGRPRKSSKPRERPHVMSQRELRSTVHRIQDKVDRGSRSRHSRRSTSPRKRDRSQLAVERELRSISPRKQDSPQKGAERRRCSMSPEKRVMERERSPRKIRFEKSTRARAGSPSPRQHRSRTRSRHMDRSYHRSRDDSRGSCSSGSVIERSSSPWRIRRRAVSRALDYATLQVRPSPKYMTRSRSRAISRSPSPYRRRWSPERWRRSPKRARTPTPLRYSRDRRSQSRFYARPSPHRF